MDAKELAEAADAELTARVGPDRKKRVAAAKRKATAKKKAAEKKGG